MLHLGQVLIKNLVYKGSTCTQESSNHGYKVFFWLGTVPLVMPPGQVGYHPGRMGCHCVWG